MFQDYNFRSSLPAGVKNTPITDRQSSVPARVIDVILDGNHPEFLNYGGPSAMGAIKYRLLTVNNDTSETGTETSDGVAYPLDINIRTVPLKNEVVILTKGPDQNIDDGAPTGRMYYSTVVSIWNNPHHGAYPVKTDSPDVDLGEGIDEEGTLAPLQLLPGDTTIEGRLGQSIRLSGGGQGPWSEGGSRNKPIIILSNGQAETQEGFSPLFENIDEDPTSIYLTSDHTIPLTLSNDKRDSYDSIPDLPSSYRGAQLLFNSNRITINSKLSDVLISSAESVGINGTSINIDSTDYLCLDADKMYLGSKARINEGAAKQPMVLGHRMEQFLIDVLDQMISLASAIGTAKTIKGDALPVVNKEGLTVADVLKQKRNHLNPKGASLLKSKKIFVE
jgi:hypothetical protein